MAIFKGRFSKDDLILLFVYTAFPIHVWTIANMLKDVPSWALYMRYWELASTVAYTLVFALFETIVVLLPVIFIGMIIPKRWVSNVFVPWAGVMLVEGAIGAIVFQEVILTFGPKKMTLAIILLAMALSTVVVVWAQKLREIVRVVAQRFSILAFLYIFFDLIGLAIVIVRNVGGLG